MTKATPEAERWRTIAGMVRDVLARDGISLAEFARRSGVSDATLRPLLAEGRPLQRADKIAQLGAAIGIGADGIGAYLRSGDIGQTAEPAVAINAVELEAAIDEVTSAMLHLRRVVDAARRSRAAPGEPPARDGSAVQ